MDRKYIMKGVRHMMRRKLISGILFLIAFCFIITTCIVSAEIVANNNDSEEEFVVKVFKAKKIENFKEASIGLNYPTEIKDAIAVPTGSLLEITDGKFELPLIEPQGTFTEKDFVAGTVKGKIIFKKVDVVYKDGLFSAILGIDEGELVISHSQRLLIPGKMGRIVDVLEQREDFRKLFSGTNEDFYLIEGEYDEAISAYTKALELNHEDWETYDSRAMAYFKNSQYDLAIADFTKIIELNPKYGSIPFVYYSRGYVYFHKDLYDKALSDYNKAIEIDSDFTRAYFDRAIVLEKMGRIEEAIDSYKKFLKYASPGVKTLIRDSKKRIKILEQKD